MVDRRTSKRRIKRREITFICDEKEYKGISSNFSETGLFIKTRIRFKQGAPVEMLLELDKDQQTAIKGKVVRITARSKFFNNYKISGNGIGIEVTETTREYKDFCKSLLKE